MTSTATSIWNTWVSECTHTTTSATADEIWVTWCTTPTSAVIYPLSPTAAERAAIEEPQYVREQAARAATERRIAAEAEKRAEELLLAILTEEQRRTYRAHRYVVVEGRSGRRYRVRRCRVGNVDVVDRRGMIESRLCCHPAVWCPDQDTMAAQLLHIQHNEDDFVRRANYHAPPDRGQQVLQPLH